MNASFSCEYQRILPESLGIRIIMPNFVVENCKTKNMKRTEVVNQISQTIHRVAPTATAILYGSEARGEARSDSDIDVLILLDGDQMSLKREMEVTGPLNEIEWQTGVLVSPTVMLRKQWENMPFKTPFYINVMNEGIRI